MNPTIPIRRQCGVTMIEMIVVIVLTGIIGGVVALFIRVPVQGYTDSVARAAVTDLADNTMRRLSRDLRLALPNSVRVSTAAGGHYIEFLQTSAGLRYLAEDDVVAGAAPTGNYLSWNDVNKKTFDVVGDLPTGRYPPAVGDYVVVYNLGEDQEPGNAYNCAAECNRARITGLAGAATIELDANPFPAQTAAGVALMSPGKRFHVVTSPVTYGCNLASGTLTRYWDYPISPGQPTPPAGGKSALVAERVKQCDFHYTNLASQRSGLVGLTLGLGIAGDTGANGVLTLEHQVHVNNTP